MLYAENWKSQGGATQPSCRKKSNMNNRRTQFDTHFPVIQVLSFFNNDLVVTIWLEYRKNSNNWAMCWDVGVASPGKVWGFFSFYLPRGSRFFFGTFFAPFPEEEILNYLTSGLTTVSKFLRPKKVSSISSPPVMPTYSELDLN